MSTSRSARESTGNRFLDSLSERTRATIVPYLELVDVVTGSVLVHRGAVPRNVSFPVSSVISAITTMKNGATVEVMLIGREGFTGLHLALGDNVSGSELVVQIPGALWQMKTEDFEMSLRSSAVFERRVLHYGQSVLEATAQFSACNRLHPITARCARWMLMAHDRVIGNEILLTHEYLAMMLGVRRPRVSLVAAQLNQAGLIDYRRGHITMRNRRALELIACECYEVVNDSVFRLLGYSVRKTAFSEIAASHIVEEFDGITHEECYEFPVLYE